MAFETVNIPAETQTTPERVSTNTKTTLGPEFPIVPISKDGKYRIAVTSMKLAISRFATTTVYSKLQFKLDNILKATSSVVTLNTTNTNPGYVTFPVAQFVIEKTSTSSISAQASMFKNFAATTPTSNAADSQDVWMQKSGTLYRFGFSYKTVPQPPEFTVSSLRWDDAIINFIPEQASVSGGESPVDNPTFTLEYVEVNDSWSSSKVKSVAVTPGKNINLSVGNWKFRMFATNKVGNSDYYYSDTNVSVLRSFKRKDKTLGSVFVKKIKRFAGTEEGFVDATIIKRWDGENWQELL